MRDQPVVARTGIQEYRRADGTIRREYRPPEEVFHPDALASLYAVPVTNGHPGVVTAESPSNIIGWSLSAGIQQDGNVLAGLVIHNPKAMGPNREPSLGYRVDLDETPGEVGGQRHDAVQRNIRVNHIAVDLRRSIRQLRRAQRRPPKFAGAEGDLPGPHAVPGPEPVLDAQPPAGRADLKIAPGAVPEMGGTVARGGLVDAAVPPTTSPSSVLPSTSKAGSSRGEDGGGAARSRKGDRSSLAAAR